MGRFERKSRKDRIEEIKAAALSVFLEKGFRNTSMEDIIDATTMSKGGFYHYYGGRDEILYDIMREQTVVEIERFLKASEGFSPGEIPGIFSEVTRLRLLRNNPEKKLFAMFVFEIVYEEEAREVFAEICRDSFIMMADRFRTSLPEIDGILEDHRFEFLINAVSGFILSSRVIPGREAFDKNVDYICGMIERVLSDICRDHGLF